MIPASYLFRNAYRQAWETTEATVPLDPRPSFFTGLMTPLVAAIRARRARSRRHQGHRSGSHAYE